VKRVDLRIQRGTIHALIGPNGAGKTPVSTCSRASCRRLADHPVQGGGHHAPFAPGRRAQGLGALVPDQRRFPLPHLARERADRIATQAGRLVRLLAQRPRAASSGRRARELLAAVGLQDFRDTLAAELSYGRKRALEIATTLALDPELMLLDEPTAGWVTRTWIGSHR